MKKINTILPVLLFMSGITLHVGAVFIHPVVNTNEDIQKLVSDCKDITDDVDMRYKVFSNVLDKHQKSCSFSPKPFAKKYKNGKKLITLINENKLNTKKAERDKKYVDLACAYTQKKIQELNKKFEEKAAIFLQDELSQFYKNKYNVLFSEPLFKEGKFFKPVFNKIKNNNPGLKSILDTHVYIQSVLGTLDESIEKFEDNINNLSSSSRSVSEDDETDELSTDSPVCLNDIELFGENFCENSGSSSSSETDSPVHKKTVKNDLETKFDKKKKKALNLKESPAKIDEVFEKAIKELEIPKNTLKLEEKIIPVIEKNELFVANEKDSKVPETCRMKRKSNIKSTRKPRNLKLLDPKNITFLVNKDFVNEKK